MLGHISCFCCHLLAFFKMYHLTVKPSSIFFTDHSDAMLLLWILFISYASCFMFVFAMLSCLFLAALRSLAILALVCDVFVTFPYGVYLIVSIPDLCLLLYCEDSMDLYNHATSNLAIYSHETYQDKLPKA